MNKLNFEMIKFELAILICVNSVLCLDMQCKCFMGLFPEISRAWITIDNQLFLWNLEDGYFNFFDFILNLLIGYLKKE